MVDTPNLGIIHIEQSQSQKEVTANEGLDELDQATQDTVDIDCSAGGTVTVSFDDFRLNQLLHLTGSPAAAFTLMIPTKKRKFTVHNESGGTATLDTGVSGGTLTVDVLDGDVAELYSDGTDVILVATSALGLALYIKGQPVDGEVAVQIVADRAFSVLVGAPGSQAKSRVGLPSGEGGISFSLRKNDTEFGTVDFTDVGNAGAFTVAAQTDFVVGDLLSVVNPTIGSPTNGDIADVSITLRVRA